MSSSTMAIGRQTPRWVARIADYVQLSKPRIAFMVLTVVAASALLARWGQPDGWQVMHALFGTLLVVASAGALNHLGEWRRDAVMPRTAKRPLPAGRLSGAEVTAFAAVCAVVGLGYLAIAVNGMAAAWGLACWFVYVWIYTPLKPLTAANTTVGAVAGALPVLIGWSAVGGTLNVVADPRGLALFLILFLWQFPHFMAIAWMYRQQYAKAGLQMLTVVDPSGLQAALQAVTTCLTLLPVTLMTALLTAGHGRWWYLAVTLLLGLGQLACALLFLRRRSEQNARRLLRATVLYLPALLLCLVAATMS
jgi:protoheme IX farnesyltransferase